MPKTSKLVIFPHFSQKIRGGAFILHEKVYELIRLTRTIIIKSVCVLQAAPAA